MPAERVDVLNVATIDAQPGSNKVAVWLTSRIAKYDAGNTDSVVVDRTEDPAALDKIRWLTRTAVVVATPGSDLSALPIEGDPLDVQAFMDLIAETEAHQARITEAVQGYMTRTRSKTLVLPNFSRGPTLDELGRSTMAGVAHGSALAVANSLCRIWRLWLETDKQRLQRTVQPRSGRTPWIMPDDLNHATVPDFPPMFAAQLVPQPAR